MQNREDMRTRRGIGLRAVTWITAVLCAGSTGTAQTQERFDSEPLVVTEEQRVAVERGLAWLASKQQSDGSWYGKVGYKLNSDYRETDEGGHVGVTSLACMAFLASGHLPGRGQYGEVVERGLDFVHDFTDAFDVEEYLYIDDAHVTRPGNEIIARRILEIIDPR